ncbi:fimbrial protein [Salmonella enterica]|nr:fimbrial protein [Salmonella enterica]ECE6010032.1 fimbrial protein [Salmonella enterica subsp. salamae]EAP4935137.1 fimbrial protein [Salmonella enterica]EAW0073975.1 fimbrial protein [Salmonella enterica]EBN1523765.1 fimbrial protein [Salmonella enterica]
MKKQLLRGLLVGALTCVGAGVSSLAQADGTPSLDLTVNANITTGTCSASIIGKGGATNTIGFGNVYISELVAKTKVETFKLRFSDCAGLKEKKATVVLSPAAGTGCAGGQSQNAEFSNATTQTPKAERTAVEVWTTDVPESADSEQFHCYNKNAQTVDLAGASTTTPLDFPLSARMVPVTGFGVSDITAGDFYSPTVFTITYQ